MYIHWCYIVQLDFVLTSLCWELVMDWLENYFLALSQLSDVAGFKFALPELAQYKNIGLALLAGGFLMLPFISKRVRPAILGLALFAPTLIPSMYFSVPIYSSLVPFFKSENLLKATITPFSAIELDNVLSVLLTHKWTAGESTKNVVEFVLDENKDEITVKTLRNLGK